MTVKLVTLTDERKALEITVKCLVTFQDLAYFYIYHMALHNAPLPVNRKEVLDKTEECIRMSVDIYHPYEVPIEQEKALMDRLKHLFPELV